MIEKLPYTLTKGVTATRDGLVFEGAVVRKNDGPNFWEETTGMLNALQQLGKLQARKSGSDGIVYWPDAAEQLRYRKAEPWCEVDGDGLFCGPPGLTPWTREALNRIAAILCDSAESFRVLHWCVTNL